MLHDLIAVGEAHGAGGDGNATAVGEDQLAVRGRDGAPGDLARHVDRVDLPRAPRDGERHGAVARTELEKDGVPAQEAREVREPRGHAPSGVAGRRLGCELRVTRHASKELVVERRVQLPSLGRGRPAQALRELPLDLVVLAELPSRPVIRVHCRPDGISGYRPVESQGRLPGWLRGRRALPHGVAPWGRRNVPATARARRMRLASGCPRPSGGPSRRGRHRAAAGPRPSIFTRAVDWRMTSALSPASQRRSACQ